METGITCSQTVTLQQVKDLFAFVLRYKNLINARAVNFFTEDHWEKVINKKWQDNLLSMEVPNDFIFPKSSGLNGLNARVMFSGMTLIASITFCRIIGRISLYC